MKTDVNSGPRDYEICIWYSAEKGDECPLSVTPVVAAEPALSLSNGSAAIG